MRRLALLAVPLIALVAAAAPDSLQLPEGRTAVPVTNPYTRVTVRADGTIEYEGKPIRRVPDAVFQPELVGPLEVYAAQHPDGSLLLAGDRRADFKAVREVLANANAAHLYWFDFLTAEGSSPRAIRVEQTISNAPPDFVEEITTPRLPPRTLHLTDEYVWTGRSADDGILLDRAEGALDLVGLAWLLDEDKRLHPSENLVIINTDDGVAYADTVAVLDLTREKGYPGTLLAGGPPGDRSAPAVAPPATDPAAGKPIEGAASVSLGLDGAMEVRGADGSLEMIPAKAVTGYESHCDATTCDVVALAKGRRILVGTRPGAVPVPGWLFGKRVSTVEGRVGLPAPQLTGRFSPIVGYPVPPVDPNAKPSVGGDPILLGALDKSLIDGVIKANMDAVRRCYTDLQRREPSARGNVVVKFVIAKDGTVSYAAIKRSEIEDAGLQTCVTDAFKGFEFPEPKGGGIVIVSYPFIFTPG